MSGPSFGPSPARYVKSLKLECYNAIQSYNYSVLSPLLPPIHLRFDSIPSRTRTCTHQEPIEGGPLSSRVLRQITQALSIMRGTLRLLAKVQPAKFLEVNAPTGLTGLLTHPQPRSTLIYTYNQILNKLKTLPESSVYRQSTEAITKSRLQIVQDTKPAGYEEWLSRIKAEVEKNPAAYAHVLQKDGSIAFSEPFRSTSEVWDGEEREVLPEGPNTEEAANSKGLAVKAEEERNQVVEPPRPSDLELEPPLDADQINEIENKIGAGLIEEVIMVAEGELTLVDEMIASRAWEPLEEKAAPGQWEYFERGTHTGTT